MATSRLLLGGVARLALRAAIRETGNASVRPTTVRALSSFKIYTRTGDKGTTALFTGDRASKDDAIFEALGNTDELSSFIGVAREHCQRDSNGLDPLLEEIQCLLQEAASSIATPKNNASAAHLERTAFKAEKADKLEAWIDDLDEDLPALTNFILPSGGDCSASLHVCRSVCRRAERSLVPLLREDRVDEAVYKFMNRLSDFLFTAARYAAMKSGKEETIYFTETKRREQKLTRRGQEAEQPDSN